MNGLTRGLALTGALGLASTVILRAAVHREMSAAATVPLCPGLTIVTAISEPAGDYETIKTLQSVDAQGVSLKVSGQRKVRSALRNFTILRTVLPEDLKTATLYVHYFHTEAPIRIPGGTALGVSTAVLRALKANVVVELGLVEGVNSALPADRRAHPNVYDYRLPFKIRRAEAADVPIPVVVNGNKVELPAVHARGEYIGDQLDLFLLDDETNPLTLTFRLASAASSGDADALSLQVVRISHSCDSRAPTTTAAAAPASRLELALLDTGRADVYDIYFDFNSDRIREESEHAPGDRRADEKAL